MKIKLRLLAVLLPVLLILLAGCDPIYPLGNIKVEKIKDLSPGESIEIQITYPTGGLCVIDWKDQNIEIVDGDDIISADGLTLTALRPGVATIKVNATTVLDEHAINDGYEERVYSTEMMVTVK